MDLHALVYASTTHRELTLDEIDGILAAAERRNSREAVTGLLLYDRCRVMQYLEGPAEGVRRVFDKISKDARHGNVTELLFEPIRTRKFGEWSMAYRSNAGFGTSRVPTDGRTVMQRIADGHGSKTAAALLQRFWQGG